VDFERGFILLPDSKTGAKPVYLCAAAQQMLSSLPRIAGNPHVIPGEKKGAARADLKKPRAAVIGAADLEGVRIHDLRHSFASFGAGAKLGQPKREFLLQRQAAMQNARVSGLLGLVGDSEVTQIAAEAPNRAEFRIGN
jgi:integrase